MPLKGNATARTTNQKPSQSLPKRKQCVYCNLYVQQNLHVRCSLNFEFGKYVCYKTYFHIFNINKVTQHVNYTCLLFWKYSFAYSSIQNVLE